MGKGLLVGNASLALQPQLTSWLDIMQANSPQRMLSRLDRSALLETLRLSQYSDVDKGYCSQSSKNAFVSSQR